MTPAALHGKVVLVGFWTYTCINWLRQLPYLRAWAGKYSGQGLAVIGVHTPEFSFEHDAGNVRRAVKDMAIDYPVALDDKYAVWGALRPDVAVAMPDGVHHLCRGPPPPGPPARVFLQQADTWLDFQEWPPAIVTAYYLRASGRLTRDAESGDAPPGMFVYDPADPTPSAGGPLLQPPGKQVDNRAVEARPDVLTYTTDPFPASQDLVGPVSARIFVRTGRRHADLFVRVCDVHVNGVSRNIVDGIRRLSPQTVPAPLTSRSAMTGSWR